MRVIEKGTGQRGWAQEFRCTGKGNGGGGCQALLLVEQGDVFATWSHARDESERHNTFRCCMCGVLTDIGRVPFQPRERAAHA